MDGEERLRWRKNIGRERKMVEKIVEEGVINVDKEMKDRRVRKS